VSRWMPRERDSRAVGAQAKPADHCRGRAINRRRLDSADVRARSRPRHPQANCFWASDGHLWELDVMHLSIRGRYAAALTYSAYAKCAGLTAALVLGLVFMPSAGSAEGSSALWNALRSPGHVALLRHAIAPGTGDPANFTIRDCSTQRNLSDEGRDQASRIGARFRANGLINVRVYASQWCRCLETARLLALGPIAELSIINSFFQHYERQASQTEAVRNWLASQPLSQPIVLVTHQVNISALTNVYPTSGELVVVRLGKDGEISVVGTIKTD